MNKRSLSCAPVTSFYRKPLFILAMLGLLSIFICFFFQDFKGVVYVFFDMVNIVWWAMLVGFLIGGFIDYAVPQHYIERLLARRKKRTLFWALILGVILSTCCHGILAIAIQLYKKGASIPAIVTLLMAAPWANFSMTILLINFFGWQGVLLVFLAMVVAIIIGGFFSILDYYKWLDHKSMVSTTVDKDFS